MTLLEVSPRGLAILLIAALAHGTAVALMYCAACALLAARRLWRLRAMPRPSECAELLRRDGEGTVACRVATGIFDFFIITASASLLLVVNFIFNNGAFRLYTVPASVLGFAAANALLGGVVRVMLAYAILLIKRLATLVLAPLAALWSLLHNIIRRMIERIRRVLRRMRIGRYTKKQLGNLSAAERDGMPP